MEPASHLRAGGIEIGTIAPGAGVSYATQACTWTVARRIATLRRLRDGVRLAVNRSHALIRGRGHRSWRVDMDIPCVVTDIACDIGRSTLLGATEGCRRLATAAPLRSSPYDFTGAARTRRARSSVHEPRRSVSLFSTASLLCGSRRGAVRRRGSILINLAASLAASIPASGTLAPMHRRC